MEYDTEKNSWKEFHKSGRGDALGWGLIFLWGALVLLIEITTNVEAISWWDGWAMFFIGFGIVVLTGGPIGLQIGDHGKAGWNFFIGFILLGFGLAGIVGGGIFWVMVLFAIASSTLVNVFKKQNNPGEENGVKANIN
ncbi:MAG: hypothetical protein JSV49_05025 [Thermoplasmata archaeon]|nr:MAG: hypothetical protein JSV49_05025 [Thermoplasmata archaeon]